MRSARRGVTLAAMAATQASRDAAMSAEPAAAPAQRRSPVSRAPLDLGAELIPARTVSGPVRSGRRTKVLVKSLQRGEIALIDHLDVDRVSAERDYMRLHVGRRSWLIHHSMAALEEGLDPELFVRLHRSAIVRKDFITGFTRNPSGRWIARLADGTEQPVGRLYSDRVRSIAGR